MSVPDTRKARPAPAVNGAGLGKDADGSQAVGDRAPDRHLQRPDRTTRFPTTTPEASGPRTPILPLCSRPPAGPGGLLLCLRRHLSGGLGRAYPSRRPASVPWVTATA
jgi:hypothetical protein